jgi:hypothetical protein
MEHERISVLIVPFQTGDWFQPWRIIIDIELESVAENLRAEHKRERYYETESPYHHKVPLF